MKGYPPGTKCVVTWNAGSKFLSVGDIVEVGSGLVFRKDVVGARPSDPEPYQEIPGITINGRTLAWPVDWLKPLEDPDEQTIEQEDEVTVCE